MTNPLVWRIEDPVPSEEEIAPNKNLSLYETKSLGCFCSMPRRGQGGFIPACGGQAIVVSPVHFTGPSADSSEIAPSEYSLPAGRQVCLERVLPIGRACLREAASA